MSGHRQAGGSKRGFTLVEVVIALALGALTVVAATALYVSVIEGWRLASEVAAERIRPSSVRFIVQQGFSQAYDQGMAPDESLGLGRPGDSTDEDPLLWFRGTGALIGHPGLGTARFFLGLDEDEALSLFVEPTALEDDRGDVALLPFPLLPEVELLRYWFYDAGEDRWEETENIDDIRDSLEYFGYPLALIEVEVDDETSFWIRVPPRPDGTSGRNGGDNPGEPDPDRDGDGTGNGNEDGNGDGDGRSGEGRARPPASSPPTDRPQLPGIRTEARP